MVILRTSIKTKLEARNGDISKIASLIVRAAIDREVLATGGSNRVVRSRTSQPRSRRSGRRTGRSAARSNEAWILVDRKPVRPTAELGSSVRAEHRAVVIASANGAGAEAVRAVALACVLRAKVLVAGAEVRAVLQSHGTATRTRCSKSAAIGRLGVAGDVVVVSHRLWSARGGIDLRSSVGEDGKAIVASTILSRIPRTGDLAGALNHLLGQVSKTRAAEALRSGFQSGNGVSSVSASLGAELDRIGIALIGQIVQTWWVLVGPAAPVSHVSSVGVVVDRSCSRVESRVGVWIVACLLSWIAKVIGAIAISIEVVQKKTSLSGRGCHHRSAIVTAVHEVHCVTIATFGIRARWRKGFDEVEEALVPVCSCRERCARGRVISQILSSASIVDGFAVVIGLNGSSAGGYEIGTVGHRVICKVGVALPVGVIARTGRGR